MQLHLFAPPAPTPRVWRETDLRAANSRLRLLGGWQSVSPEMHGAWLVEPECMVFAGFHQYLFPHGVATERNLSDWFYATWCCDYKGGGKNETFRRIAAPHVRPRCVHDRYAEGLNQVDRGKRELAAARNVKEA